MITILGIEAFKQAIRKRDVCIARSEVFPSTNYEESMVKIVKLLKESDSGQKAKIVVLFCSNHLAQKFLKVEIDNL